MAISGGFLQRLLQRKAGELTDKQRTYLISIKKEIDRIEKYILHFLDVSRLESGQLQLVYEICNPDKMLRELISGFQVKALKKNIRIDYTTESQVTSIAADKVELERAVSNLLDNAIKYSPDNSEVKHLTFPASKNLLFFYINTHLKLTGDIQKYVNDS